MISIASTCRRAAATADVVNPCETETLHSADIYNRFPPSTLYHHQYNQQRSLQQSQPQPPQQPQQQQHLPAGYGGYERRYPGVGLAPAADYDQGSLGGGGGGGLMEFTAGGKFVGHLYESPTQFEHRPVDPSVAKATAT